MTAVSLVQTNPQFSAGLDVPHRDHSTGVRSVNTEGEGPETRPMA